MGPWIGLILAAVSVTLATGLGILIAPLIGVGAPFITYFPALLIAGVGGGAVGAGASLILSTLAAGLLFVPAVSGSAGWLLGSFVISGGLLAATGALLTHTVGVQAESERRRQAVESELRTLVDELGHRAKNGLAIVMAIVSQTARNATSVEDCAALINARLDAMARAQDEVTKVHGRPVRLRSLLTTVLAPFDGSRFVLDDGAEELELSAGLAGGLALLIHELATNAVKYGALSVGEGQVLLAWSADEPGRAVLTWTERGGPPVAPVNRTGFGTRLLQSALQAQGGTAERRLEPGGAVCIMAFPAERADLSVALSQKSGARRAG